MNYDIKKPNKTAESAEYFVNHSAAMIESTTGYKASDEEKAVLKAFYLDEITEEECNRRLAEIVKKG